MKYMEKETNGILFSTDLHVTLTSDALTCCGQIMK